MMVDTYVGAASLPGYPCLTIREEGAETTTGEECHASAIEMSVALKLPEKHDEDDRRQPINNHGDFPALSCTGCSTETGTFATESISKRRRRFIMC
jgi:hypothetical protein